MKNVYSILLCLVFFMSCEKKQEETETLETGVSYELAKYRKEGKHIFFESIKGIHHAKRNCV